MTSNRIYDLVGARGGGIGAFTFDGVPSENMKNETCPVIVVHVQGVKCWFLTRGKKVTPDWCRHFAMLDITNHIDMERFDYSLLRVKMPSQHGR